MERTPHHRALGLLLAVMSGRTRVFLWACRVWLLVMNGVAGAYSFGVAAFYSYVRGYFPLSSVIIQIVPPIFDFYYAITATLGIVCVGHCLLYLRWFRLWLRRRRAKLALHPLVPNAGLISSAKSRPLLRRMRNWAVQYAPEIIRTRMLIEVALQTFQANKTSQLVANRWINELMAVVLISNCWFSLVVEGLMRNQPPHLVRVVRLVVDSMLDIAYCVVIPLSIFYPYYRDFIGGGSNFPIVFYYTDAWYANAISEVRQILMSSWTDCISKLVAALTMLYRMFIVDVAITKAERQGRLNRSENNPVESKSHAVGHSRMTRALDAALLVWGVVVVALYTQAAIVASQVSDVDCMLEMRPWGSTRYSCAALEIDCIYQGTLGDRAQVQAAFEKADPLCVQILILSNCPRLEMPTTIQKFPNLLTLKVYNSTISSWAEDAALRTSLHPTLGQILLPRVNMSEMPVGLLADDFPRTVWDIEMSRTNLSTLPSQIVTAWKGVRVFLWEGNPRLTMIPDALLALPSLWAVSLPSNGIGIIRDDAFENCSAQFAYLGDNPLTKLPTSIRKLNVVGSSDTKLAEFPAEWTGSRWLGFPPIVVGAGGTPVCAQTNATIPEGVYMDCSSVDINSLGYPIQQEDQWRERTNST